MEAVKHERGTRYSSIGMQKAVYTRTAFNRFL